MEVGSQTSRSLLDLISPLHTLSALFAVVFFLGRISIRLPAEVRQRALVHFCNDELTRQGHPTASFEELNFLHGMITGCERQFINRDLQIPDLEMRVLVLVLISACGKCTRR